MYYQYCRYQGEDLGEKHSQAGYCTPQGHCKTPTEKGGNNVRSHSGPASFRESVAKLGAKRLPTSFLFFLLKRPIVRYGRLFSWQ